MLVISRSVNYNRIDLSLLFNLVCTQSCAEVVPVVILKIGMVLI